MDLPDTDDWNPMDKDYDDINFNSYLQGPGKNLDSDLLPGNFRQCKKDLPYKLHVRNIPPCLQQQGLVNLFSNCGKVLDVYKHPSHNWAFVTYSTFREADNAIRELNHNGKLFNLVVQFARSSVEKERMKQEQLKKDMLKGAVDNIPYKPSEAIVPNKMSLGFGRGSLLTHLQEFRAPGRKLNQTGVNKKEENNFFSHFVPGFFDTINSAVMESLCISVASEIGFRKVTMGRGYFPLSKVPSVINAVGEIRHSKKNIKEKYEYGNKIDLWSLMNRCKICETMSANYCQLCDISYCSRKCQIMDWPEHKKHCNCNGILTQVKSRKQKRKNEKDKNSNGSEKIMNDEQLLAQKAECNSVSVIENLSENDVINGRLTHWLQQNTCCLSVVPVHLQEEFDKIKVLLPLACENHHNNDCYKPELGEMVGALVRDEQISTMKWNRAYVLSVHKDYYQVNLCDLGRIAKVTTVRKLPQEFISIPEFGVHCTIVRNLHAKDLKWVPLKRELVLKVKNVNKAAKKVTCCTDDVLTVALRPWSPNIQDGDLEVVTIESGETVVLSTFFNQNNLYIRPASHKSKELFGMISREVTLHCYAADHLTIKPYKKLLVGCRFPRDGNYYRAQILDIDEHNVEVCFVDYGNIEIVTQDNIIELNEEIKMYPCLAMKVSLEDVDCVPLTKEALEFIFNLIGKEIEMRIFLDSNCTKLQLPEGDSLSQKLNTLLKPSWEQKMQQGLNLTGGPEFMEQDLPVVELPLNKPVELHVLNKMDDLTFMCYEFHSKTMYYIQEMLTKQITEYCRASPQQQYVPRYQELCLAKWDVDGKWYRALYISDNREKLENNVLFIDFGNMAYTETSDIRKMIPDFINIPSAALMCSINCNNEFASIVGDLVKVGLVYEAMVTEKTGHGSYLIEMPHVSKAIAAVGKEVA